MDKQLLVFIAMSFPKRFIQLRKEHKLTQQEMADQVGMHITQDSPLYARRVGEELVKKTIGLDELPRKGKKYRS